MVTGAGHVATSDPASEQVKVTVTSVLFHPFAFGGVDAAAVIVGLVVSMLIPPRVTEPMLPARSVAWPEADRFVPSDESVMGAVSVPGAKSDKTSVAVNVTVTGPLFQPLALASGRCAAVTTGGV